MFDAVVALLGLALFVCAAAFGVRGRSRSPSAPAAPPTEPGRYARGAMLEPLPEPDRPPTAFGRRGPPATVTARATARTTTPPAPDARTEPERLVEDYVRSKLPALRKAWRKSHDRWGVYRPERWKFSRGQFIDSAVRRELGRNVRRMRDAEISRIIDRVMEGVSAAASDRATGAEYEALCARMLREAGWSVEETAATGDHGVDLVASRAGLRTALQCKRHRGRVGNAAVQAVVGGAAFYAATRTAVVSTGEFTPAARDLAAATGTLLLHHDQLRDLERLLGRSFGG